MRRVTVKAPEGRGSAVAELAYASGAGQVWVHQVRAFRSNTPPVVQDVVEVETATPVARAFIDALMAAPFYDPASYAFSVVHPRATAADDPPVWETRPVVVPTIDVYEDLWQFSHVTVSLIDRVFLAALLLAYGMIEMHWPLMITGLLFLPYHHQMLAISLGLSTREWRLAGQGALALTVAAVLIVVAGACMAWFTEPPLRFSQFGTLTTGFSIALIIGIAAALASADDAGRRELIGLAATAHITIVPAWFGIVLVFGFPEAETVVERFLSFGISVGTLIVAAGVTYAWLGMHGDGLRRFARRGAD